MQNKEWQAKLALFDQLVELSPNIERKGKTMPYTSANGHMFSLLNKDGEFGIRLSKESGQAFMEKYDTTGFKSHGATMRGYVLVPDELFGEMEALSAYLEEAHQYVLSLPPK